MSAATPISLIRRIAFYGCAGLGAAAFGLASILYDGEPSGVGVTWGAVAVVGGVAFIALAEWAARRARNAG